MAGGNGIAFPMRGLTIRHLDAAVIQAYFLDCGLRRRGGGGLPNYPKRNAARHLGGVVIVRFATVRRTFS